MRKFTRDLKRVVVKVGSSSITHDNGIINLQKIDELAWELSNLKNHGIEVVLVSSGAIAAGAFTFTMTAVPGTPQIQNLIPIQYFGTSPTAAPILGLVATAILFFGSLFYLEWRKRTYAAKNEVFTEPEAAHAAAQIDVNNMPKIAFAIIPLFIVIIVLNFLPKYIGLAPSDPKNIILALLTGIAFVMILT